MGIHILPGPPYLWCMYSKKEAALLKEAFWTAFGQYMLPVPPAEGEKTNWINYRTGEKDIYFRMDADNKRATIGIILTHKNTGLQQLYFEQFRQLQPLLDAALQEAWTWVLHTKDEHGKIISMIFTEINNVSIFNREHWPQLISFFKPRIVALDHFWLTARHSFEALG